MLVINENALVLEKDDHKEETRQLIWVSSMFRPKRWNPMNWETKCNLCTPQTIMSTKGLKVAEKANPSCLGDMIVAVFELANGHVSGCRYFKDSCKTLQSHVPNIFNLSLSYYSYKFISNRKEFVRLYPAIELKYPAFGYLAST